MYLFGVLHGGKGTACQGRSAFLKEENAAATTAGARTSPGGRESGSPSGNTQPRSISSCSEGKEKQFTSTGFSERGLTCYLLRVSTLRGRGPGILPTIHLLSHNGGDFLQEPNIKAGCKPPSPLPSFIASLVPAYSGRRAGMNTCSQTTDS